MAITPDGARAYLTSGFGFAKVIDTDPASGTFHTVIATVTLGNGAGGIAITPATDDDLDGFSPPADCDDGNAAINPDATEVDDGVDNNCDGQIDEGFDLDGDGFTPFSGDCDDGDPDVFLGNPEVADGKDNDCNGLIDDIAPGNPPASRSRSQAAGV